MPITPDIAAAEAAIIEMTNAFRAEQKLPPVRSNPHAGRGGARLCQEARRLSGAVAHGRRHDAVRARRQGRLPLLPGGREPRLHLRHARVRRRRLCQARGGGLGGIPRAPQEHDAAVRHRDRRRAWRAPRRPSRSTSPCSCSGGRSRRAITSRSPTCRAAMSPTRSRSRRTPSSRARSSRIRRACRARSSSIPGDKTGAVSRYETRAGQLFTVKPGTAGAVTVEVKQMPPPSAPPAPKHK